MIVIPIDPIGINILESCILLYVIKKVISDGINQYRLSVPGGPYIMNPGPDKGHVFLFKLKRLG